MGRVLEELQRAMQRRMIPVITELHPELSEADSRLLYQFRRSFTDAHNHVAAVLRDDLHLEPTARVKSNASIKDKLLRQPTLQLIQMQDIAGCRVIVQSLDEQSRIVARLVQTFEHSKTRDRRERPSHGYRAVHVIVEVSPKQVEIQVRTILQHAWAELSEKLSDKFGMSLKYGGGPEKQRAALFRLSDIICTFERVEERYTMDSLGADRAADLTRNDLDRMTKLIAIRLELEGLLSSASAAIGDVE
jgi:ppGpp synthetase/RelA/SpoT-type nucleotidyltranferase